MFTNYGLDFNNRKLKYFRMKATLSPTKNDLFGVGGLSFM